MCAPRHTFVPEVCVFPCRLSQVSVLNKNSRVPLRAPSLFVFWPKVSLNLAQIFYLVPVCGEKWSLMPPKKVQPRAAVSTTWSKGRKVPEWLPRLISSRFPRMAEQQKISIFPRTLFRRVYKSGIIQEQTTPGGTDPPKCGRHQTS